MSNRAAELRQLRPPPIQTSFARPQTAPGTSTPSNTHFGQNSHNEPPSNQNGLQGPTGSAGSHITPPKKPNQLRFVLGDPLAFRYLEEDPSTSVLERRQELQGYECYVVEQWATSRSHPTFTITTYTGDPNSTILVDVLSVPTDESTWSARLRVYFKALNQYHAKRRETPLGILMVTNLSGFPSSLTVIAVPDGDLRRHRSDFFVNENLKRLNCSGRVGLTLGAPAAATVAKFHQVYRTSDKNEVYQSVIELVKLCQSALMLFDKLEVDYADGLLCDITERAITDWWVEVGSRYYSIEPHDGILGPTTVAGLLGLLMGARNRLHAVSSLVPKDVFDVAAMKKGISAFQKQQRIPRSRRLDRLTLERLHKATQKAANSDGLWTVPRAVKSTVAELSGKGGDRVMDVVQRKDRASIAEIETCDMDRFVQLVYGERAKWLWYGRPLKSKSAKQTVGTAVRAGEEKEGVHGKALNFRENEHGGFTWTARKSVGDSLAAHGSADVNDNSVANTEPTASDDEKGKGLLKRTSGFKEAKGGLGRIKDAVGLGSHHHRNMSKDIHSPPQTPKGRPKQSLDLMQTPSTPAISPRQSFDESLHTTNLKRPSLQRALTSPVSSPEAPRQSGQWHRHGPSFSGTSSNLGVAPAYAASYRELRSTESRESMRPPSYKTMEKQNASNQQGDNYMKSDQASDYFEPSDAGSAYGDGDFPEATPNGTVNEKDAARLLQRTVSESQFITLHVESHLSDAYPRHLSFSLAEDSVLTWTGVADKDAESYFDDSKTQFVQEEYFAEESKNLRQMIRLLDASTVSFTQSQLQTLEALLGKLDMDQRTLDDMQHPVVNHTEELRAGAAGVLQAERARLEEAGSELETLGQKLEYEISGLKAKIDDVQTGVGDFERNVGRVEDRVAELEKDEAKADQGWGCVAERNRWIAMQAQPRLVPIQLFFLLSLLDHHHPSSPVEVLHKMSGLQPPRIDTQQATMAQDGSDGSDDHYSSASEGTHSPLPITRVERVDDAAAHGEVPNTPAYNLRLQDAVPDEIEVIPEGRRSRSSTTQNRGRGLSSASAGGLGSRSPTPGGSPIPKTVVEKVDFTPRHGEVEGTPAKELRMADATPDEIRRAPDADGSSAAWRHRVGQDVEDGNGDDTEDSEDRQQWFREMWEGKAVESSVASHHTEDVAHEDDDGEHDAGGEDDFGDDFDDFAEEGEGADFGEFDESHNAPLETTPSALPPAAPDIFTDLPPLDLSTCTTPSEIEDAISPYINAILPNSTPTIPKSDLPPLDASQFPAFQSDRSLSLWQQLVSPPPMQPPNWTRSRIRRLFLVSLGVPVDLDEILPPSKQKRLVLPSVGLDDTTPRPGSAIEKLREQGINNSSTSLDSKTGAPKPSKHRRTGVVAKGPSPPPEMDLNAVSMLCSTTEEALTVYSDPELKEHVFTLEILNRKASGVLEYWLQRKDESLKEKEALEGVIENLVGFVKGRRGK